MIGLVLAVVLSQQRSLQFNQKWDYSPYAHDGLVLSCTFMPPKSLATEMGPSDLMKVFDNVFVFRKNGIWHPIHQMNDLKGVAHIRNAFQAIQFVRLRTSSWGGQIENEHFEEVISDRDRTLSFNLGVKELTSSSVDGESGGMGSRAWFRKWKLHLPRVNRINKSTWRIVRYLESDGLVDRVSEATEVVTSNGGYKLASLKVKMIKTQYLSDWKLVSGEAEIKRMGLDFSSHL